MGKITNREKRVSLTGDQVIVFYEKGSYGKIVGVYDCVRDFFDLEKPLNNKFWESQLYSLLVGVGKSFFSRYHNTRIVPKIKNRSEIKD